MIEYVTNRSRPWFSGEIRDEGTQGYSWPRVRFDAMVFPVTGSGGIPGYYGFTWATNYMKEYGRALSEWANDLDIRKEPGRILYGSHRIGSPFWCFMDVYSIPIRDSALGKAQYRWIENGLKTLCDRLSEDYSDEGERARGDAPTIAVANLDQEEELNWDILKGIIEKTIGRLGNINFKVYVPDKAAELEGDRQAGQAGQAGQVGQVVNASNDAEQSIDNPTEPNNPQSVPTEE